MSINHYFLKESYKILNDKPKTKKFNEALIPKKASEEIEYYFYRLLDVDIEEIYSKKSNLYLLFDGDDYDSDDLPSIIEEMVKMINEGKAEQVIEKELGKKVKFAGTKIDDHGYVNLIFKFTEKPKSIDKDTKNLLKALSDNFEENWKSHAEGSIPKSNPNMINVYDFNEDEYESLRPKWIDCDINNDTLEIEWCTQDELLGLDGMYDEIKRWAEYIKNTKCGGQGKAKIDIHVYDRDGYDEDLVTLDV